MNSFSKKLNIAVDHVLCKKGMVQDYFWFKSETIEIKEYQTKKNCDFYLQLNFTIKFV